MHRLPLFAALLFTASTLAVPTAASAADGVTSQIAYALQMAPGGVQTSWNQVTWSDGAVLTVEPTNILARASATSTCPSGKFCAFTDLNGAGTHLDFSACPSSNGVGALTRVWSIANARSSGTVTGRSGSSIVVTVSPGAVKNVTKVVDKVVCAL
jgi:hypothetical protein